ncbi:hypothetical protein J1605_014066 [Eschrichtius robustus]|uniref:Secreted protein n=1 Tax=Eschrichtius robustus TaxID=9764 RepID=A0AB34GE60_ESCRO|nr:hypothetical protein J1605_014066 [Eschrichtius robustus]
MQQQQQQLGLRPLCWTSLVAQWLRICLPMQGTWVRALVREDPTCRGAAEPVHYHNEKPARSNEDPIQTKIRGQKHFIKDKHRASLVVQWLRVRLPMQATRVRALVWEDPACRGATGPVSHNCWVSIKTNRGFPGGAVVENLPANAGHTDSSPGLGRSHMPRSDWAREPQLLSLRAWSPCSTTRGGDSERPAHRDEEWPPLAATRESPRTETKTRHSQK